MQEQFSNKIEKEIFDYWEKNSIPEKVRSKKADNNYYFIDCYKVGNKFSGKELAGKRYEPILGEWLKDIDSLKKVRRYQSP